MTEKQKKLVKRGVEGFLTVMPEGYAEPESFEDFYRSILPAKGHDSSSQLRITDTFPEAEPIKKKKTYPQEWTAYNLYQTNEGLLFTELLKELLEAVIKEDPLKRRGRPSMSVKDMIFACCMKIYLDRSARRASSELKIFQERGLLGKFPHFNTVLNYLNKSGLTPILKSLVEVSSYPLKQFEKDFAVDSTGFSTPNHEKWFNVRTAKPSVRRLYKKAHILTGTLTKVITAVEITKGTASDTPELPPLLETTAKKFIVEELSADLAYSSKANLQAVVDAGGFPYIPFKKNANPKGYNLWHKAYTYLMEHYDDFMAHYHKRSNVEALFSALKRKLGTYIKTKKDVAQANEILCKCLCHNLITLIEAIFTLDAEVNFCAEAKNAQIIVKSL
ncbi:transposase [Candidatus Woesearchaeota archaeon]|nr:transposase [Candidatus Woesearchaeota archaeon]